MPQPIPEPALNAIDTRPHLQQSGEPGASAVGPGWFDSSWDLHRGLEVREGWSGEERAHGWIEDFLETQRTIGRIASPSASTAMA